MMLLGVKFTILKNFSAMQFCAYKFGFPSSAFTLWHHISNNLKNNCTVYLEMFTKKLHSYLLVLCKTMSHCTELRVNRCNLYLQFVLTVLFHPHGAPEQFCTLEQYYLYYLIGAVW